MIQMRAIRMPRMGLGWWIWETRRKRTNGWPCISGFSHCTVIDPILGELWDPHQVVALDPHFFSSRNMRSFHSTPELDSLFSSQPATSAFVRSSEDSSKIWSGISAYSHAASTDSNPETTWDTYSLLAAFLDYFSAHCAIACMHSFLLMVRLLTSELMGKNQGIQVSFGNLLWNFGLEIEIVERYRFSTYQSKSGKTFKILYTFQTWNPRLRENDGFKFLHSCYLIRDSRCWLESV